MGRKRLTYAPDMIWSSALNLKTGNILVHILPAHKRKATMFSAITTLTIVRAFSMAAGERGAGIKLGFGGLEAIVVWEQLRGVYACHSDIGHFINYELSTRGP